MRESASRSKKGGDGAKKIGAQNQGVKGVCKTGCIPAQEPQTREKRGVWDLGHGRGGGITPAEKYWGPRGPGPSGGNMAMDPRE